MHILILSFGFCPDYILDNLAVDADGQLWAAGMQETWVYLSLYSRQMTGIPQALAALAHMLNPSLLSPSVAARISINTGPNAFYGEKYKVEKVKTSFIEDFTPLPALLTSLLKVFEDDGKIMSGITSAVYDSKRKKLFMNGTSFI